VQPHRRVTRLEDAILNQHVPPDDVHEKMFREQHATIERAATDKALAHAVRAVRESYWRVGDMNECRLHEARRSGRARRPRAARRMCNASGLSAVVSAAVARRIGASSLTTRLLPHAPQTATPSMSAAGSRSLPQTGQVMRGIRDQCETGKESTATGLAAVEIISGAPRARCRIPEQPEREVAV